MVGGRSLGVPLDDRLDPVRFQPLDDALLHAGIPEGKPALALALILEQHILKVAERAPTPDRALQAFPQARVLDRVDKGFHIAVATRESASGTRR